MPRLGRGPSPQPATPVPPGAGSRVRQDERSELALDAARTAPTLFAGEEAGGAVRGRSLRGAIPTRDLPFHSRLAAVYRGKRCEKGQTQSWWQPA